jgi:DNA polymerase-1
MKKLVIIDGKSVLYRGFYAMGNLRTSDGIITGGIYGFASILLEVLSKVRPDYVAVAWDKRGTNIRRRLAIYPEYKAGRAKAPDEFYQQIPLLMEMLADFHIPLYEADDFEADDIMGTLSTRANQVGVETILISGDLDMLQLVDHDTKFYALKTGFSKVDEFDLAAFRDKYGIDKSQFLDLKALKGDSSDNIPGVPGIGEKTAIKLLQQYGTLDSIYEHINEITGATHAKLSAGKDSAYMSRELGEIMLDAPTEFDPIATDISLANPDKVLSFLQHLQFRSLIPKAQKIFGVKSAAIAERHSATTGAEQAKPVTTGLSAAVTRSDSPQIPLPEIIEFDIKSQMHLSPGIAQKVIDAKSFWDLNQAAFLLGTPKPLGTEDRAALYRSQRAALDATPRLLQIYTDYDLPLIPVLYRMEQQGISVNHAYFKQLHEEFATEQAGLVSQIHQLAGTEFNLNSPAQLSEVLFDKLAIPTKGLRKKQKFYSTDARTLEKLHDIHPVVPLIERYREVSKLISTYIDALPALADQDNHIHTTFTQDVTATGRLSSKDPNLQNIPVRTDEGRRIRTGFVAAPGNTFISADYSQFELRLAAVMAGDEALVEDFNSGIDIHTKTASSIFGIPIDDVTKSQRRAAKTINFGVLYGMSAKGLSDATDMSIPESADFIHRYFQLRSPVRAFLDQTLDQARTAGYVETYYGRRRYTPDVHSKNFLIRQSAERAAMNMPIQGTESDLMKRAMIQLDQLLRTKYPDVHMILQIHDSIMLEAPAERADELSALLKQTMENIAPELKVKLSVDVSVGTNWGEL